MHERPRSILAFAWLARSAMLSLFILLLATAAAGNLMRLCEPCSTLRSAGRPDVPLYIHLAAGRSPGILP